MSTISTTLWNGKEQVSGVVESKEVTQLEYNAIPESVKNSDNVTYFIKDAVTEGQTVQGIQFRINEGKLQYRYDAEVWDNV